MREISCEWSTSGILIVPASCGANWSKGLFRSKRYVEVPMLGNADCRWNCAVGETGASVSPGVGGEGLKAAGLLNLP